MAFDGSGRRVVKAVQNSGDWDCTYHYYHDGHRIVETRNGSDLVLTQQVWGLDCIDELVQTGVNQDLGCSGTYPETPEQAPEICERFFWIVQDANYNVLGSVAATGLLTERYEYDPYGRRTVFGHNCPCVPRPWPWRVSHGWFAGRSWQVRDARDTRGRAGRATAPGRVAGFARARGCVLRGGLV